MRMTYVILSSFLVFLLLTSDARTMPTLSKEKRDVATGRASMLGRFEPIVSQVVLPFLVATGVVSLVRMVPSVVSQLPGVFGFAKRHGYEEMPKEFMDLMQMLDGAVVKYAAENPHQQVQRYPVYQHMGAQQQQPHRNIYAAASQLVGIPSSSGVHMQQAVPKPQASSSSSASKAASRRSGSASQGSTPSAPLQG